MKIWRNQRGSITVLTALAGVVLIGFSALVADVGLLYLTRVRLATMADAAALAGARELLADAGQSPRQAAQGIAALNGLQGADQLLVDVSGSTVTVTARRRVDFFLAPVLGLLSSDVSATAGATAGVLAAATGVVPFGVEQQSFTYGEPYVLKSGDGQTGNYGGLALGGTGANVYEFNVEYGYEGTLRIGDEVYTKTGNMSGPTSEGVTSRIGRDPAATFPPKDFESPRIIIVPIIDSLDVNGQSKVTIVGFAAFFLEGVAGSGNENYVTGRFIKMPKTGEISNSAPFYGLYDVKLIK